MRITIQTPLTTTLPSLSLSNKILHNFYMNALVLEKLEVFQLSKIILLRSSIMLSEKVRPICLPDNEDSFEEGTLVTVTGWRDRRPIPQGITSITVFIDILQ